MGLTPLGHISRYVDPWLGENLDERQAITQLYGEVEALTRVKRSERPDPPPPGVDVNGAEIAARLVISLANHVWLWKDWPDYVAAAEGELDWLQTVLPTTKGWGRWSSGR